MTLQPHILSHLSQTGLRCSHCHFTFQTPQELSRHQELHRHGDDTELSPGLSSESLKHIRDESSRKDVLESPAHQEPGQRIEPENGEQGQSFAEAEVNSGNKASFSYTRVKSEPSSPRLASSPIQHHLSPAFPIAPFMPHVPFSKEITAVPQASEILAKMSELVHRRLRHGGSSYPPVMYGTLVPKGATCFECNITFSSLDNYLVHKKHYCTSRWQHMAKPQDYTSILDKAADPLSPNSGGSLGGILQTSGHSSEVKGHDTTQFNLSMCDPFSAGGKAEEVKKASTPSGAEERPNGMQLDAKSPKMPPAENMHTSQTTCEACKITFSRQETFVVHKQYYCATRHDPPMKRANGSKSSANQKSVRARKRRKAYDQEQMHMGPPSYLGIPYMAQDTVESFKDQFHQRYMIQGLVPKQPEPSLTVPKSALVSKCNAIAQEEGDAPIDLSKKCLAQFGTISLPAKAILDYHECAACKISFNRVGDYLTHKQNFCPGTALENRVPSIKKECFKNSSTTTEKAKKNASMPGHAVTTADIGTSPEKHPISIKEECSPQSYDSYPSEAKKTRADEQLWPYYEIKATDYATGMLGAQSEWRQSPNEGSEGDKEQPMPDGNNSTDDPEENPKMALNDLQPEEKSADLETEPNGILAPDIQLTSSMEVIATTPSPAAETEEIQSSIKKGSNGSISTATTVKYCRPCDIQFNNLSNFITHKKFYCSAHATEHVK